MELTEYGNLVSVRSEDRFLNELWLTIQRVLVATIKH
jgi:hypothetical protein